MPALIFFFSALIFANRMEWRVGWREAPLFSFLFSLFSLSTTRQFASAFDTTQQQFSPFPFIERAS